jgi:hypothetical protein
MRSGFSRNEAYLETWLEDAGQEGQVEIARHLGTITRNLEHLTDQQLTELLVKANAEKIKRDKKSSN